ncbi:very short patch repair endonuclease [Microbacterium sp. NPDC008134]|uniref:very short patch repair endonuclease n=1 Tax=Microbacterium sp. NPDC008134 TaxID=3364183 RepID=UPI0036F0DF25
MPRCGGARQREGLASKRVLVPRADRIHFWAARSRGSGLEHYDLFPLTSTASSSITCAQYTVLVSWATSEGTRRSMRGNQRRDTAPELAVRRLIHSAGLRYRVDFAPLGGRRRADIVFTRRRIVVFIDGCFWHGCPDHAALPKSNTGYWLPKLQRNIERDLETNMMLENAGWKVLRFWEHEPAIEVARNVIATFQSTSPS